MIGWMLLTGGAKIENAGAQGGVTTEATLARTGAKEIPSDPKLSVEPRGLSMIGAPWTFPGDRPGTSALGVRNATLQARNHDRKIDHQDDRKRRRRVGRNLHDLPCRCRQPSSMACCETNTPRRSTPPSD
jgi:hypothetical protein